jgi:hypothetical protein
MKKFIFQLAMLPLFAGVATAQGPKLDSYEHSLETILWWGNFLFVLFVATFVVVFMWRRFRNEKGLFLLKSIQDRLRKDTLLFKTSMPLLAWAQKRNRLWVKIDEWTAEIDKVEAIPASSRTPDQEDFLRRAKAFRDQLTREHQSLLDGTPLEHFQMSTLVASNGAPEWKDFATPGGRLSQIVYQLNRSTRGVVSFAPHRKLEEKVRSLEVQRGELNRSLRHITVPTRLSEVRNAIAQLDILLAESRSELASVDQPVPLDQAEWDECLRILTENRYQKWFDDQFAIPDGLGISFSKPPQVFEVFAQNAFCAAIMAVSEAKKGISFNTPDERRKAQAGVLDKFKRNFRGPDAPKHTADREAWQNIVNTGHVLALWDQAGRLAKANPGLKFEEMDFEVSLHEALAYEYAGKLRKAFKSEATLTSVIDMVTRFSPILSMFDSTGWFIGPNSADRTATPQYVINTGQQDS